MFSYKKELSIRVLFLHIANKLCRVVEVNLIPELLTYHLKLCG